MKKNESVKAKLQRFQMALEQFLERIQSDRYVLAAVLVGSLGEETIWRRESLWLWIIEADGVTRRLRSDGKDERIFRALVEGDVNVWAELIPRSRFKQMVEGSSRTAFSCNFFATRQIVYSADPSIDHWFETANTVAKKDQQKELLAFTTWAIHAQRHAKKELEIQEDLTLARQTIIEAAHSIAHLEVIRSGEVCESEAIYRGIDLSPDLFQTIYLDVLARKSKASLVKALKAIEEYLLERYEANMKPLLMLLKKENRTLALSEISDHFAFSQLYPWHLLSACDWLEEHGVLEKISAPFKLTKRSSEEVEEPAFFWDE